MVLITTDERLIFEAYKSLIVKDAEEKEGDSLG